jgi:adenosylmethionine-8-amino-7-oxononanoate aminotransferase
VSRAASATDRAEIVRLDKAHVWHPYTAMDDYIDRVDPIVVVRAAGARLYDADGRSYLDGNSSWFVATLGHAHPRLLSALKDQADTLAHCALAGITHEPAARLAEELVAIAPPGLSRVFFTDDGSTAIEVAVKMAVQMWRQVGAPEKTRFVALEGAFHGDSLGAASLGGIEVFRRPFAGILFDCVHAPFPARDAYARAFEAIANIVATDAGHVAAVVVEPVVQGSAGMRMYDPDYLRELSGLCRRHDVLLIVDEVFTGYGRTGPMWACEHAGITPDLFCIGKAMSPLLPMGATLATARVEAAFRGGRERALLYGHTLCGNPLGAALAREVLAVYREEKVLESTTTKAKTIAQAFERIGSLPGVLGVRSLGMIGAADLGGRGYLGGLGWQVFEEARRRGAYLRPLGDTVYVTPPLTIDEGDLEELLSIVHASVAAVLRRCEG